jgi:hypothetical protein
VKADALVQATYDDVLSSLSPTRTSQFLSALTALVEGPLAAPFHMESSAPPYPSIQELTSPRGSRDQGVAARPAVTVRSTRRSGMSHIKATTT